MNYHKNTDSLRSVEKKANCYVDSLFFNRGKELGRAFRHREVCHLYADTPEALKAMAYQLGLKPGWMQTNGAIQFYPLSEGRRSQAVMYGAVEHTDEQAVAFIRQQRECTRLG